jgi:uncharacterized protein (DUF2384 family)
VVKAGIVGKRDSRPGRETRPEVAPKRSAGRSHGGGPTMTYSERKSIEKLAAAQGVKPTRLEDILGKGADLWESDREFERFVEDIYARRREDRELARQ